MARSATFSAQPDAAALLAQAECETDERSPCGSLGWHMRGKAKEQR
jgi:hypothetical protein